MPNWSNKILLSNTAIRILLISFFITLFQYQGNAQEHPKLILTKAGVEKIRAELGNIPLFDASLAAIKAAVDAEIALGIDTPIPKDYSGGYTHTRHKQNWFTLQKAGVLYQILDDEKYAKYVKDMLMQYEEMYKTLPLHPKTRSYARGKLFWQCLNDSNWLVYVSQAYDCIYDYLTKKERKKLEKNLFRPFADHISVDSPQFYQRVHNHSTWGNAAVGMIGLVMNDQELIDRALYGIKGVNLDKKAKDDDGGYLNKDGKAGFLANIEEPFSPEGYYNEGPYYQRYAMYPFLIFAEGLHNVKPELNIFKYKDGVLLKSINALLNLSDADGDFFPLNDGQKGMSYYTGALVTAVNISYQYGGRDPQLLSIAKKQGKVLLDDSGLAVAIGVRDGKEEAFEKKSINLTDGPDGKQGGVGILRNEGLELVFKYAAQGSSHGHYDKLSYSLYEDGNEVLQDHFYDDSDTAVQVVSAKEKNAYPGTEMHRTMAVIKDEDFEKPFLLDMMRVTSNTKNQYDLPFYFMGQAIKANFEYESPALAILGEDNGYQHLYLEGKGTPSSKSTVLSWLGNGNFYTLTTITDNADELLFTRLGANDPEFNLRRDAGFMLRRKNTKNTTFVTVIESHGSYSPVTESAINSNSNIKEIKLVLDTADYTAVSITTVKGNSKLFITANTKVLKTTTHTVKISGKDYTWTGSYTYQ